MFKMKSVFALFSLSLLFATAGYAGEESGSKPASRFHTLSAQELKSLYNQSQSMRQPGQRSYVSSRSLPVRLNIKRPVGYEPIVSAPTPPKKEQKSAEIAQKEPEKRGNFLQKLCRRTARPKVAQKVPEKQQQLCGQMTRPKVAQKGQRKNFSQTLLAKLSFAAGGDPRGGSGGHSGGHSGGSMGGHSGGSMGGHSGGHSGGSMGGHQGGPVGPSMSGHQGGPAGSIHQGSARIQTQTVPRRSVQHGPGHAVSPQFKHGGNKNWQHNKNWNHFHRFPRRIYTYPNGIFWVVDFSTPNDYWRVDSAVSDIEVVRVDLYDQTDHLYGADYYVRNRSDYPVYVSLVLAKDENVIDGLADGYVYVGAWEDQYVGYVVQDDPYQPFEWSYQWQAYPATRESGVQYYYE